MKNQPEREACASPLGRNSGPQVAIMEALIRRAVPEDAQAIAALHIRTRQIAYRGQLPDHYLDHLDQQLNHRIEFWQTEI